MCRYQLHWHPEAGPELLALAEDPRLDQAAGQVYAMVKLGVRKDGIGHWDTLARVGAPGLRLWSNGRINAELVVLAAADGDDVYVLAFGENRGDKALAELIALAVRRAREF